MKTWKQRPFGGIAALALMFTTGFALVLAGCAEPEVAEDGGNDTAGNTRVGLLEGTYYPEGSGTALYSLLPSMVI